MSDTHRSSEPDPAGGADTAEEVRRLQAERDALVQEVEKLKAPRRRRFRRAVVGVLVALSCLLVVLSTTVVWAHRTVLNTDTFVGTVGPVFQYPGVDTAVATRATDQLFTQLHLQTRLRDALPPKVGFAAGPITSATEGYVSGQLAKVLGSERFQAIWTGTLTSTHETVVAVLRGKKTSTISTANGYIVLNTVPIINRALGSVSGLATNLTGKKVSLPAITSAEPPKEAIDKLSKALGVKLPSNYGQITLVRSTNLGVAQRGVRAFDRLTILLPLLTLLLIAFTFWLSVSRRRTLVQLLVGSSLLLIVVRRVVIHEQSALANGANNPHVAQTVLGELLHGFFLLTAWLLAVALVLLVVALLAGPYRWAVALRRFVARTWRRGIEVMSGERRARSAAWVRTHADGLQLVGAVVAGILLLIISISWWSFLIIGALVAVYEVALQWTKGRPRGEPPAGPGPGDETEAPTHVGDSRSGR
ncbi:MAG: hypothetical protein ABSC41_00705 [Acidimicrobiales bacterium]|jgi:hypothetical protein